jgi:glycine cleavage system H lipoate-binding protein
MTEYHTFVDYVLHTKLMEYGVAFLFIGLFAIFYRLLQAPAVPATAKENVLGRAMDYIRGLLVPEGISYHLGHTWARLESAGLAAVGLDDFANKLIGRIDQIKLPAVGTELRQGEKAWSIVADGKTVDMIAPVEGKVVAINAKAVENVNHDPYGQGWLLKVESPRLTTSFRNLLSGLLARKWTEQSVDTLFARANATVGAMAADGGAPVSGMAKQIDAEHWDKIASEFFFTNN